MIHISVTEWRKYINNEIDEKEREFFENHLYSCDQCLAHYLEILAEVESKLPQLNEQVLLVDNVMEQISAHSKQNMLVKDPNIKSTKPTQKNLQRKQFYEKTIFHYTVAAVATIVLMISGVFNSMIEMPTVLTAQDDKTPSFTEGLINTTFSIMDEIDEKLKEKHTTVEPKKETKNKGVK